MTAIEFKSWRKAMGFRSQKAAAAALGVSPYTVVNYERGIRRDTGEPVHIPRVVALACAAIAAGLSEWSAPVADR